MHSISIGSLQQGAPYVTKLQQLSLMSSLSIGNSSCKKKEEYPFYNFCGEHCPSTRQRVFGGWTIPQSYAVHCTLIKITEVHQPHPLISYPQQLPWVLIFCQIRFTLMPDNIFMMEFCPGYGSVSAQQINRFYRLVSNCKYVLPAFKNCRIVKNHLVYIKIVPAL